jgi:putative addiction module component (TIGR02574 family)
MSTTLGALGVDRMTVSERLQLLEAIWDSIPDAPEDLEMPEWQRDELTRRLAAADADPSDGIPWEELKTRLEGRS